MRLYVYIVEWLEIFSSTKPKFPLQVYVNIQSYSSWGLKFGQQYATDPYL